MHRLPPGFTQSPVNARIICCFFQIDELEQDRALGDKSELDEMLDNARKEKDALESQVASLQEQLSLCQCEILRLKEHISILQEECKVTRNNAKCTQSELEYKCDQLRQENTKISTELQGLQEAFSELQVCVKKYIKCFNDSVGVGNIFR